MKVQVTRDSDGICIWYDDVELICYSMNDYVVWFPTKFGLFKKNKVFSRSVVDCHFAYLRDMLDVGMIDVMELDLDR